jgi:hypothetical protein
LHIIAPYPVRRRPQAGRAATTLYERLGLPEADQIRAQLTATAGEIHSGP